MAFFSHTIEKHDVDVDGNGDITIRVAGGYYGDEVERDFSIAELEEILKVAKAHKAAYDKEREGK